MFSKLSLRIMVTALNVCTYIGAFPFQFSDGAQLFSISNSLKAWTFFICQSCYSVYYFGFTLFRSVFYSSSGFPPEIFPLQFMVVCCSFTGFLFQMNTVFRIRSTCVFVAKFLRNEKSLTGNTNIKWLEGFMTMKR